MALEFSNLPLEEVVIRAYLENPRPLLFDSLFEFVQRLGAEYRKPSQLQEFDALSTGLFLVPDMSVPGISIPRGDNVLLTLQPNVMTARWRRSLRHPYPRYGRLRETLENGLEHFFNVFTDQRRVRVVNMAYVNLIVPPTNPQHDADLWNYLCEDMIPGRLKGQSFHDLNFSWRSGDTKDLRVIVQRSSVRMPVVEDAGSVDTEQRLAFMLTTSSGTFVDSDGNILEHVDEIHEALQVLFMSVITDHAREEWGYGSGD